MEVKIVGEFIKIGQLIKKINIIDTGGGAKYFLESHNVLIDEKKPIGRNTKVFVGSIVWIDGEPLKITN